MRGTLEVALKAYLHPSCGEDYPSKIKLRQRARTTNILLAIQELQKHNKNGGSRKHMLESSVCDGLSSILWNPLTKGQSAT